MKVIVEADGGSRGNPGPAGYGSVVWSADHGTVLAESKQAIGRATNNIAEYRGLIAGLEEAGKLGATEVEVLMDSKLVVEQMSGRWQVKHPDLRALLKQAKALDAKFDRISYAWIPRAENSHADRLANEAMDAAAELEEADVGEPEKIVKPAEAPVTPAGWTGARGAPTRFLLLRHGQTELSAQRRYSGRGNPGADRRRAPSGRGRRAVSRAARRHRGGHHVAAATGLRHRGEGGQGARARRHRRRRSDRDGLRRVGGADLRARPPSATRNCTEPGCATPASAPPDGESFDSVLDRVQRVRGRVIAEHGGRDSACGVARDADQDAAPAGARRRTRHPVPIAPGPGVAVHRRVLPRRGLVGAVGQRNVVPVVTRADAGARRARRKSRWPPPVHQRRRTSAASRC